MANVDNMQQPVEICPSTANIYVLTHIHTHTHTAILVCMCVA